MRTSMRLTVVAALLTSLAMSLLIIRPNGAELTARASSHREAPLIITDPAADNTDVYAFRSPDRPETVTLIANFIPFQEPAGGPNFYPFDDNVLYQIRLDNNGDAVLDLAIEFRFRTVVGNGDSFLYNGDFDNNGEGTINSLTDPDWNVKQFYSVMARVRQGNNLVPFMLADNVPTPPNNVGPRSTPNYETALAEPAIRDLGGGIRVFAGQRDEGFFFDLGSGFDLFGLRPLNSAHLAPLPNAPGTDGLAGFNVNTIAIQLPTQLLTANAQVPTAATDPNAIIGVYATASRSATRVLNGNGTITVPNDCANGQGIPGTADDNCIQVSRLANPLVNELFIPRGASPTDANENDKDRYNAQLPITDATRDVYVRGSATRPVEPVRLINLLYPPVLDAPTQGRNDLVRVFLTGVPGATRPPVVVDPADPSAGPGAVPSDLMRLNVAVPVTATPNRLGVIAGDLQGYPNGRRPADDVADISLRVAAGILLPGNACANGTANCNSAPNNALTDGVDANDRPFRTTFPYLASPTSGYNSPHGSPTPSPIP